MLKDAVGVTVLEGVGEEVGEGEEEAEGLEDSGIVNVTNGWLPYLSTTILATKITEPEPLTGAVHVPVTIDLVILLV